MVRMIARLLLSALAFTLLFPAIPGMDFHGNFAQALVLSVVFSIMLWLVDVLALAISAALTISTLGLALLWLIPLWFIGFWLLPAVTLKVVAEMMPAHLTINGWLPAILGGLVMLVISMATSGLTWRAKGR